MALVTCTDCGTSVSDAAAACVKCGRPIAGVQAARSDGKSGKIVVLFFLVCGFIGVVAWIALFGH
jgi:hypothetical protein